MNRHGRVAVLEYVNGGKRAGRQAGRILRGLLG
jgi:hypothetical protein